METETAPVLVRYRLKGPAVDQRLVVYADGQVELDERHRSRGNTRLSISGSDLHRLNAALDQVPASAWSRGGSLSLATAGTALRRLLMIWPKPDLGTTHFELRRGRRRIAGETGRPTEAEPAREFLDSLRAHAVQTAESQNPTGGR